MAVIIQIALLLQFHLNFLSSDSFIWDVIFQGNRFFRFTTMDFIDEQNGWIGGRVFDSVPPNAIKSVILKTTDAGNSWTEQRFDSLTNSSVRIEEMKFLDSFTGILTSSGRIYFTQNGGTTWTKKAFQNDTLTYYTANIINDSTWIVGGGDYTIAAIKKTVDFGTTWYNVFTDTLWPVYSMDFVNDSCGIAVAGNRVLSTNNYGEDWNYVNQSPNLSFFRKVQWAGNEVFALARDSTSDAEALVVSSDNGYNWNTRYIFSAHPAIFCMHFADSLFGRVGGITSNDDILLTTDGGFNWTTEPTPVPWGVYSLYTTRKIGFAGMNEGYILKTELPTHIKEESQTLLNQSIKVFPNPGNGQFTVSIYSPIESNINVKIYDILGKRVVHLIKDQKVVGNFDAVWNGKNSQNIQVSSGVYFAMLETTERVLSKKFLLVR